MTHPHISAGRIPTDKGYRYYVDRLMKLMILPAPVQTEIKQYLISAEPSDLRMLMEATSRILSKISRQLGVILAPRIQEGIFRHIHIHTIGGRRCLLHLTIDSGFVKTMVIEAETDVDAQRLEHACAVMNQRFGGKKLEQMCENDESLLGGLEMIDIGIIRLFIPSIRKMIKENAKEEIYAEGEANIVLSQEHPDPQQVHSIVEILEKKKLLMHVFSTHGERPGIVITIGGENKAGQLDSFSVIKTKYRIGNMEGTLGVIGPKRMPYAYLASTVEYTARALGELYGTEC